MPPVRLKPDSRTHKEAFIERSATEDSTAMAALSTRRAAEWKVARTTGKRARADWTAEACVADQLTNEEDGDESNCGNDSWSVALLAEHDESYDGEDWCKHKGNNLDQECTSAAALEKLELLRRC